MRINTIVYAVLVLVVFFGTIAGFQTAGIWSISGKVDSSGEAVRPSAADVSSIKGWMTLDQVATTFGVPVDELLTQFDLPADTSSATAIKDLESDLFDTTTLRTWLQNQTQVRDSVQSSSAPPASHPIEIPTSQAAVITAEPTPAHVATEMTVSGKTTFQDLLDWGVSKETIEKVIGGNLPAPSTIIKDYITGKGLEFPDFKTQLQAEVHKVE